MKILIIGVGSIGERHLNNLLKLGYKNLILSDFSKERLRKLSVKYNLTAYSNWRLALQKSQPDLTFICTSADSHVPMAKAAVRSGSDVFIEKPLAVNFNGIDDLIRLAKQRKKIVMVACNYLFNCGFQKLKKILERGFYGNPLLCRVVVSYYLPTARKDFDYKNLYAAKKACGGGVILDSGSHVVNYLRNIFGEVRRRNIIKSNLNLLGIQSEEAATLVMEHQNGLLSTVVMDYLSKKSVHRLEVVTSDGLLTLDIKNDSLIFEDEKRKKIIYQGPADLNKAFIDEIKHFMQCVKKRKKPLQSLSDAKRCLNVLLNI